MKLRVNWADGSVHLGLHTDDGALIDRCIVPEGMEIEWTVHENRAETEACVALDRAFGEGETHEERQRAETD